MVVNTFWFQEHFAFLRIINNHKALLFYQLLMFTVVKIKAKCLSTRIDKHMFLLAVRVITSHTILLLDINLKKQKTLIENDTCSPMFTAASLTIAKARKQPKCPSTEERTEKKGVSIHSGVLLSPQRRMLPFAAAWTDFKGIMLRGITDKGECYMV